MSYTEIFKFKKDGNADYLGEVKNAWRGAMAIWMHLEKKYLPPYYPEWAQYINDPDREYSRTSSIGNEEMQKIWDLVRDERLTEAEKIAMVSTFDNVIVERENIPFLVKCFREFEGETSLKEQADVIELAYNKDDDLVAVAWNQTSVNGDTWMNKGGYDEDPDEEIPYNILTMNDHWSPF